MKPEAIAVLRKDMLAGNFDAYIAGDRARALASGEEMPDRVWDRQYCRYLRVHAAHRGASQRAGPAEGCRGANRRFERSIRRCIRRASPLRQQAMGQVSDVTTPGGTSVRLAMKITVVAGRVRRFVVGDPTVQLIERTGRGYHGQAGGGRAPGPQRRGRGTCARLADRLTTSELRGDSPDRVAVVVRLSQSRLHHWETKALTCTASWVLRWLTRTMRPEPAPLLSSSSASWASHSIQTRGTGCATSWDEARSS